MTPIERTTQERDRRFARARFITNAVLMGSLTTSVLFVGYAANLTHSANTTTPASIVATAPPSTVPATRVPTTVPAVTTTNYGDDFEAGDSSSVSTSGTSTTPTAVTKTTPSTAYTPPTTAPVKAATVCTTTPSGRMICH